MRKLIVGIDLGTTFSKVAYLNESGKPEIVRNIYGKELTPSVVKIKDGIVTVGEAAYQQWNLDSDHVVRWIKREIGNNERTFQGMTLVQISAEILKTIKRDVEIELGIPIDEAVVACPACFTGKQVEDTRKAGLEAGLHVREIVREPLATAVCYGVGNLKEDDTIAVLDLGGGIYDATIIRLENGELRPLAATGDTMCGGHDWTTELYSLVRLRCLSEYGIDPSDDLTSLQYVYEQCETAKLYLQRHETANITCKLSDRMETVSVSRAEFEENTEWLIERVVRITENALTKADLTWDRLDKIVLSGGSSRLRRFGEVIAERSGGIPEAISDPQMAVALGAALLAGQTVAYRRTIAKNLGVRVIAEGRRGEEVYRNTTVIPANTEVPVKLHQDYSISAVGQKMFQLPVIEFEHEDGGFDLQHNYAITCPPGIQKGDKIRVEFSYSIEGIPSIRAFDMKTGNELPTDETRIYEEPMLALNYAPEVADQTMTESLGIENSEEDYTWAKIAELLETGRDQQDTTLHPSSLDAADNTTIHESDDQRSVLQRNEVRPEMPAMPVDLVHFSATLPPSVLPGTSFVVDIWAHLEHQRRQVLERAKEEAVDGSIHIKSKGPAKVIRGTILTVSLRVAELTVDPLEDTILWEGEIGNANFALTVPETSAEGAKHGLARVRVDGLEIARLNFTVQIGRRLASCESLPVKEQRHRTAFASYASEDADAVLGRIQGMQKMVPSLNVFYAAASLHSGERWQDRLRQEIRSRDVMYLFWSEAASRSQWVDWEWRCGFQERGIDFIDPCPLISPDVVLPPKELADVIHFNDWTLAYMRNAGKAAPS